MIPDDVKIIIGALAIGMTIWAHIPYLLQTLRGTNKPHIFTWVIWSILTFIAFAAQLSAGGGFGAWVTGVTGLVCLIITIAAIRQGEKHITYSDRFMFLCSLSAIPVWMMTSDPLLAVIIVTAIDISAIYPTFRKSWHRPHQENSFMYGFNIPRHTLAILALQTMSWTTALYPAGLLVMNIVMYVMLKIRRKTITAKE